MIVPDWLAWQSLGEANGAASDAELFRLLARYRSGPPAAGPAAMRLVGCTLITQPVFFPDALFVPQPKTFVRQIVRGKTYDMDAGEGRALYDACRLAADGLAPPLMRVAEVGLEVAPRFGAPRIVHPRLGQGAFRLSVLEAYDRACAVTTEHSLPVLESAHIRPYARGGEHAVSNGLCLRSDLHALFDLGYVTVTDDHRLHLSSRLRADYGNGKAYEPYHGRAVRVPAKVAERPSPELLRWHQSEVFREQRP